MGHHAKGPEDMGQTGQGEEPVVRLLPWDPTGDGGRRGCVPGEGGGGQTQGWLWLSLLMLAAQRPSKLPETRVISDERQTERGK